MGKTFEEWYNIPTDDGYMSFEDYIECSLENSSFDSHEDIKQLMKEAWEASRLNMTTRDI